MWRWWFLSLTSVVAATACSGGGQTCWNGADAAAAAPVLTAGSESFTFEKWSASSNSDCKPFTSFTFEGKQKTTGFPITFCIEDAKKIGSSVDVTDPTFHIEDVSAQDAAGCTYAIDSSQPGSGKIDFQGFCTDVGAGYNITFAASYPGKKTCAVDGGAPAVTPVTLALAGSVAVKNRPLP
jgi:hypothetical protein